MHLGALNYLMGPFHVIFCGGWAWVEVARYSFGREVGASVEESASDCFEDCQDCGATQQLMRELDAVGLGLDNMCEQTKIYWVGVWQLDFCSLSCSAGLGTST